MKSKTALITGAGQGIGEAVALALAQGGYDIGLHYRSSESKAQALAERIRMLGREVVLLRGDLTRPEEARGVVLRAEEALSGLDVLINNVGNYLYKPVLETSAEEWNEILASNLNSTFYTCQAVIPLMRVRNHGRIVNFGYAGAQHLLARPGIVPYAIAKAGVLVLGRSLAKTEVAYGISVNTVAPGVIENSVTQPKKEIPAGRVGAFQEVTDAVMYFVEASAYVTGQVIEVAGGWNL